MVFVSLAANAAWASTPTTYGLSDRAGDRTWLSELINEVSDEHGVDPRLTDAVVRVESGYDPRAVSRRGALGLMQLMPETARRLDVGDPFDPEQNLRGGVREVARLIDRYSGNLALALAAYNAGESAVERFRGIPPYNETHVYVTRIMTLYTGRPYRLPSFRVSPVRMERDVDGRVVITNHARSSPSQAAQVGGDAGGGRLRGGFGAR